MPARVSPGTYYPPLPPPKEQKSFPHRKTSVKSKTRLPSLTKSQSTLTQRGFPTPASSREVVEISSDDEYEGPKSSNKRKRCGKFDKRQPGQSSMTQFDRGELGDFLRKRRKVYEVESDDFDIWEDYEAEKWEADLKARQAERINAMPWLQVDDQDEMSNENEPEIPETSQPLIEASPIAKGGAEVQAHDQAPAFQTPKKIRFQTEVPSSQTPPSTNYSDKTALHAKVVERSPLKERRTNSSPVIYNDVKPESQNTSMWMLERVKLGARSARLKKRTPPTQSPEKVKSSQDAIEEQEEAPRMKASRPSLTRYMIQDSQVDVAGSLVESDGSRLALHFTNDETVSPEKFRSSPQAIEAQLGPRKRPRNLCRSSTIQDSQLDGSDALTLTKTNSSEFRPDPLQAAVANPDRASQDIAIMENSGNEAEAETFDEVADDDLSQYDGLDSTFDRSQFYGMQSTYDPAFSALDRDAARFQWTQTQAHIGFIKGHENEDEIETDAEDLDFGCKPRVNNRNGSHVDRSSQRLAHTPGEDHGKIPTEVSPILGSARHLQAMENTNSIVQQAPAAPLHQEVVQVPSSPPPRDPLPDPSQASTIVQTQSAQPRVASLHIPDPEHPRRETVAAPAFSIVSSPQRTCSAPLEMPSSSPLPLPPWSSPRNADPGGNSARSDNAPNSDASLRGLVDFSLPPPPPLSSGRSRR